MGKREKMKNGYKRKREARMDPVEKDEPYDRIHYPAC